MALALAVLGAELLKVVLCRVLARGVGPMLCAGPRRASRRRAVSELETASQRSWYVNWGQVSVRGRAPNVGMLTTHVPAAR